MVKFKHILSGGVLIVVLVFISLVFLYFLGNKVIQVKEYDMYLSVGDHIGLNVDNDSLYFGTVDMDMPSGMIRTIRVKNFKNYKLRVNVIYEGDILEYMALPPEDFVLKPYEEKELLISTRGEGDFVEGYYDGKVRIIFRRLLI